MTRLAPLEREVHDPRLPAPYRIVRPAPREVILEAELADARCNDTRIRQLRFQAHPPIGWGGLLIMFAVAAFIGLICATGGVL